MIIPIALIFRASETSSETRCRAGRFVERRECITHESDRMFGPPNGSSDDLLPPLLLPEIELMEGGHFIRYFTISQEADNALVTPLGLGAPMGGYDHLLSNGSSGRLKKERNLEPFIPSGYRLYK
ncbi:hypothetical protein EVAR_48353_1 [Eumeta japonica]|uniref:Uncharacterized protein n=1 Tax=Eumeta variegata TaxID=151549 RepID=A0A4C1WK83_EUMVA|nr:hypothetical protein EVAR_48353_1 [Eumeta japonica]